jgi:hypothetical protein
MLILQGRSKRGTTSLLPHFNSVTGIPGEFYLALYSKKAFLLSLSRVSGLNALLLTILTKQMIFVNKKHNSIVVILQ